MTLDLVEIVRHKDGKWYIYSKDGQKKLGGPYYTEAEAKRRLAQIEYYKHVGAKEGDMPVEKTENYLRFRQTQPGQYERFAVKKLAPGIQAVMGFRKGSEKEGKGGSEVQSMMFDKEKFTLAQAKKWLSDHDMKTGEAVKGVGNPAAWVLCERLALCEQKTGRVMMSELDDEDLQAARAKFCAAKCELEDQRMALPAEDRYSSSVGVAISDDIDYYRGMIRSIEYEMQGRMLPLEPAANKAE